MKNQSTKSTLVLVDDGLKLTGFSMSGDLPPRVLSSTSSSSISVIEGIGEICQALGRHKKTVVATSDVTLATLNLPPGFESNISNDEINKMLHWEMQPYLNSSPPALMLGQILVTHELLSHAQLSSLLDQQKKLRTENPSGVPPALGSLAVEANLLTQKQLDDSLAMQPDFAEQDADEQHVFGISAPSRAAAGQNQAHQVTAISRTNQKKWKQAAKKHGLQLAAILPLAGLAGIGLAQASLGMDGCIIEIHHGFAAITHLSGKKPHSFETRPFPTIPLDQKQIHNLIHRVKSPHKLLKCKNKEIEELVKETGETIDPSVSLDTSPTRLDDLTAIGAFMTGTQGDSSALPAVPLKDPPVPLNQRAFYRPALITLCIAALFTCLEMYLASQLQPLVEIRNELAAKDLEAHDKMDEVNELQDQIGMLDTEIAQLTEQIGPIENRNHLIGTVLENRTTFHNTLYEIIASTIDDQVILDQLSSLGGQVFYVEAWSLSQEKADQFVQKLAARLNDYSMTVLVKSTRPAKGRLDLDGRQLTLHITPTTVAVEALPKEEE